MIDDDDVVVVVINDTCGDVQYFVVHSVTEKIKKKKNKKKLNLRSPPVNPFWMVNTRIVKEQTDCDALNLQYAFKLGI